MPDNPTPWVGLAALVLMFLIPFLPSWLFEGPRTIRHRQRRHVCTDCGAAWTQDHACQLEATAIAPQRLQGEIRRLDQ